MEQATPNPRVNPESKKRKGWLWLLIILAALSVVFLVIAQIKKEKAVVVPTLIETAKESEAVNPPKVIYYMTATVTEKRENELAVSGMIPQGSMSGKEELRLVTTDEKTQVIKISNDNYQYQEASFGKIQKGDKIEVKTLDDFKNNESVLALTITIFPASNVKLRISE